MAPSNQNLKLALDHLGLTNLALAKALSIDPSVISRYLSGKRRLRAASPQVDAIADFILARSKRVEDIQWLKTQFQAAGLPTDLSTVYRFKQNLVLWLATDGETLRRNLGHSFPGDIAGHKPTAHVQPPSAAAATDAGGLVGAMEIVLALRPILASLPAGSTVNLFLSNDRLTMAVNGHMAALLYEQIAQNDLYYRMVVCVSGDTQAMSVLLDTYMSALISGHIRLSVVRGVTQTVTSALHILIPGQACILVSETVGSAAPPIASLIRNPAFVTETEANFEATARYAEQILSIYGDEYTRNVIEILALEYCTPGALDVVKDSINPMFMTPEAYDRFLKTRGHTDAEFQWRSAEFARFKAGMDGNLKCGVAFREIIALSRLNDIVIHGRCRMAGLYFAQRGYVDLDTEGCLAILNGYLAYLENEPNFQLLILDDLADLHGNNCWHIKRDGHVTINNWQEQEPVMIYSDQLMLLREFQLRFDSLWAQGSGSIGTRANVTNILRETMERLSQAYPPANP